MSTPVWVDDRGDPWIEVEPGRVAAVDAPMRERIRDKIGTVPLEDVQQRYSLRRLVPETGEPGVEFRRKTAEFMDQNDELLRKLASSEQEERE